ncbi:hypothetical protein RRG08_045301 [Elysia crispata]|uniref:Uncharacterized protein n=1 Tax=Elysia crispata TaxID=231223 RepID=A0AAE1A1L7_9GAST|nr:hypothetical protein RRG08_045301 [Elysia crispata]
MESIDNILTVSTLIYCPTTPNLLPVPRKPWRCPLSSIALQPQTSSLSPGSHGEYRQHSNSVHSHLLPYNPKPSPCPQEAMESIDNILTVSTLIYCPTTPNLLPVPRKPWRCPLSSIALQPQTSSLSPGSHGEYRQHSNSVHSHLLPYNPKPPPCPQEAMESIDNILTVSTLIYCPTTPNLLPVPRKPWRCPLSSIALQPQTFSLSPGSHGEYRQHSNSVHSHLLPYNPKPPPCPQEAMESIDNILTVSTLIYCPTTPNLLPVPRKPWREAMESIDKILSVHSNLLPYNPKPSPCPQEAMESIDNILTEAMESIDNIRTVAALTKEQKVYDQFSARLWEPFKENMRSTFYVCLISGATMGMSYWSFGVCFFYGSRLLEDDDISFDDIFRVCGCVVFCSMQFGRCIAFAPDFNKGRKAASFIFSLHDKVPPIDAYSTAGAKPDKGSFTTTISFKGIHFRYPMRRDVKILNGLDLRVEPGQTLALVGESGCGKSTTVQLVERFYDPELGSVYLDKYNLKDLNLTWLRAQIGLVSQEPILFDQSIAENIAYGDNSRTVSMDEIIQAAKSANIHNFIQSLPMGYFTNVGSKGTQLSGGQKQRVAIARGLIRNPKILLLDEATSALDNESEKIVQEALDKARAGRTCITIAHRLTTIKDADKIAVFKNGVVHEIGTHDTLMAKQGLYFKLQKAQHK